MTRTAFDMLHPAAALAYFAALLVLVMTAIHPVYVALAWTGVMAHAACLNGPRAAARSLAWQAPVVAVVALANCVFVASGSTELLRVGTRAFYAESLAYGACSGGMLACVIMAFSNASNVLTSDKVMGLLGNAAPTVSLMVSMTARLVPQFVRRGQVVGDAARACTAAGDAARQGRVRRSMRLATVLMGWGMEDSLETADAMRARGWGAAPRRTSYARRRFRRTDAAACAVIVLLAAASAAAAWAACAQLSFYPRVAGLAPWWSYAPFALFVWLPVAFEALLRREDR